MLPLAWPDLAPVLRESEIVFTAGAIEVHDGDPFVALGVELRLREGLLGVEPILGLTVIEENAGYAYGGLRRPFDLGGDEGGFFVAPSFAAGWYEEGGAKDLGGPIELRSSLEIGYAFEGGWSLGLAYYHLSNSRLYEDNNGTEALVLTLALDSARLFD
jgi:hypothetical protein